MTYRSKPSSHSKSGFTLLEMLLVIAIIAILAAIVIVAINPARQLAQARNAARASDLNAIYKAVGQYYIDNLDWPSDNLAENDGELTEICDTGDEPGDDDTSDNEGTCDADGMIDLSELVPLYLQSIPVDPGGPVTLINQVLAAAGGTGYFIALEGNDRISLSSQRSTEQSLPLVAIGTTTEVGGEGGGSGPCDATGGDESTDGEYTLHTFTSDGTFEVASESCDVDLLVVAGGGSGAAHNGSGNGGGGAGGLIYETGISVSGSNDVIVGDGGIFAYFQNGTNGENSSFDTYEAIGGGGGGGNNSNNNDAGNGGSGIVIVRYLTE